MVWRIIFLLFPILVTLTGCVAQPTSSTGHVDDLSVEIWASKACAKPGEQIILRGTLTNNGETATIIETHDNPVLDLVVAFPPVDTNIVARWSDGKSLTPDLTHLELKSGDSKTIEMNWIATQLPTGGTALARTILTYSPKFSESSMPPSIWISIGICPYY